MSDLKPCPFCGWAATRRGSIVACSNDDGCPCTGYFDEQEWNRRVPDPEGVERARKVLATWLCNGRKEFLGSYQVEARELIEAYLGVGR